MKRIAIVLCIVLLLCVLFCVTGASAACDHWRQCLEDECYYCGAPYSGNNVIHDYERVYNNTYHWEECMYCYKVFDATVEKHYRYCNGDSCYLCSYSSSNIETRHAWSYEFNDTVHWGTCADCGFEIATERHDYLFDNEGTGYCYCGAEKKLAFTEQPKSVTVANGATAKVTVAAFGKNLTYTWYVKSAGTSTFKKSSITGKTYSVAMNGARNGNQLYCVAKDEYGNTVKSNTVTIKMKSTLAITTQPKSVTVSNGATAKVTIAASGSGLTYTWYVKSVGQTSFKKSAISGSVYSVAMNSARNGNQLYCVVKDQFGYSLTSNTVTIKMRSMPVITTQPKSTTVAKGAKATVTISASGEGLSYIWYVQSAGTTGFKKSSITGKTYSVTMTDARDGNKLFCIAKDKYGNGVKSDIVTIAMKANRTPPVITTQPKSVTVANGARATVSVAAKGDGLTYTWYVKSVGTGASSYQKSKITGSTYSVTMNSARNGNILYCVVGDKYGNTVRSSFVYIKMK